ncbi:HNH endonuclease [Caulobacter sp. X]|uniref:HNH endonuclease n=1 Tax=Caulobacter sp. X TaxID=2048901 RepID=UPI000C15E780|nr:HNH endonuclease [Caulobacter sp. X]PIB97146.1 HNH endonuclease [Caulobacter sp. X]
MDADFLAPRRCFREPIPEIFEAARLLSEAADQHLSGNSRAAEVALAAADLPAVRAWTESLWGSAKAHPEQALYLRVRVVANPAPHLLVHERVKARMPNAAERATLIAHYGHQCVFCRMPLIRPEVRRFFTRAYPTAAYWGNTNKTCHAAFQCMWLQYDHVLPHARGGSNALSNLVLTCAGCNYGRVSRTLEEVGLLDPRMTPPMRSPWDGLERILRRTLA